MLGRPGGITLLLFVKSLDFLSWRITLLPYIGDRFLPSLKLSTGQAAELAISSHISDKPLCNDDVTKLISGRAPQCC
jgi:hypothetical protein